VEIAKDTFKLGDSGLTQEEIQRQSAVATGKDWLFAKKTFLREDSRALLEGKGFTIIGEQEDIFYKVEPVAGLHRETIDYHMNVINANGEPILHQFCKLAPWDKQAEIEEVDINK
jgi:hypothetical protein